MTGAHHRWRARHREPDGSTTATTAEHCCPPSTSKEKLYIKSVCQASDQSERLSRTVAWLSLEAAIVSLKADHRCYGNEPAIRVEPFVMRPTQDRTCIGR
jgi:hypothetical protein